MILSAIFKKIRNTFIMTYIESSEPLEYEKIEAVANRCSVKKVSLEISQN